VATGYSIVKNSKYWQTRLFCCKLSTAGKTSPFLHNIVHSFSMVSFHDIYQFKTDEKEIKLY